MTREEVRDALVKSLCEVQREGGRPIPDITDHTVPFRDLPGFDSLIAEEVASDMEEIVACDIKHHKDVFLDGQRLLSIREIIDRLCELADG